MTLQSSRKIQLGPTTALAPVPVVLVGSSGRLTPDGPLRQNLTTIAWAGTINSDPPMVSISVRKSRLCHDFIRESGEFVINLVNEELVKATDFCGVRGGREHDKYDVCGLTPVSACGLAQTAAVLESPVTLSCQVRQTLELPSHDVFFAEVIGVEVQPELMKPDGQLDLAAAGLVAYLHGEYFSLGQLLGFFGFSVARPEVLRRRMKQSHRPDPSRK